MKNKVYRIRLWIDNKNSCVWDIYAKTHQDAQAHCERLKECCRKNGGWNAVEASIKLL